jgi:PTS system nitrogen regulatory IIA component
MKITDVLIPSMTYHGCNWLSKKRVLENLSTLINQHLSGNPDNSDSLFQNFLSRERLGSTAIGDGVAIPHCRVPGVKRIYGCLITLKKPINFEAFDGQPVDLIFALVVPEEKNDEHLATLARVAKILQNETSRKSLRECQSDEALFNTAIMLEREA